MLAGSIAFLIIGFAILIYSGDCLVRGALAAAFKTNVSPLMVGILIVGFGTSMPEFLIGVQATLAGKPGLAHGNIIGSNIANIWLVLALPAVIFPIATAAPRMRLTSFFMLLVTAAWIGITRVLAWPWAWPQKQSPVVMQCSASTSACGKQSDASIR